jgi:hypothetical protein
MDAVRIALLVVGGYAAIGGLVGLAFVLAGVSRTDHAAKGSSIGFRLLILPGSVALWPLVLVKWMRGGRA